MWPSCGTSYPVTAPVFTSTVYCSGAFATMRISCWDGGATPGRRYAQPVNVRTTLMRETLTAQFRKCMVAIISPFAQAELAHAPTCLISRLTGHVESLCRHLSGFGCVNQALR